MHDLLSKYYYELLLFFASLAVLLPVAMTIQPFEIPDENAHYASLHFLNNSSRMPNLQDSNNLSREELATETVFGVVEGQNKYSYHPEYRLEYLSGLIGKYEPEIRSYNTSELRQTYLTKQAALYPPLYYWLTLPFYRLVSNADILTRLFASRFSSVLFTTFTVLLAYWIGQLVFRRRDAAVTLAVLVLFYPMTAYIGSGVNSDNLHNLIFAFATLLCLKIINSGWNFHTSLAIGVAIGLDLLTKPQGYILFPIFALAALCRFKFEWKVWLKHLPIVLFPVLILAGWQEIPKSLSGNLYSTQAYLYTGWEHFRPFAFGYLRIHLTEMPVWYWGAFKWFGVLLPKVWWWTATRLVGLAGIGLLFRLAGDIKEHKFSPQSRFILFTLGANFIYVVALFWFDWQFYQQFGRSLGLQARYYMPLLISQMALLLLGFSSLGWNKLSKDWLIKFLTIFFLGLQLTSFYTQLASYYDIFPLSRLLEQISQYKPIIAKGSWWYLWFSLYFAGIITGVSLAFSKNKDRKII